MAQKFLNEWFPKKHQLVTAVFASYVGIYGLIKIAGGNPEPVKATPAKAVVVPKQTTVASSGYVAPNADNIGTFFDNPANVAAWEKSLQ